MPSLSAHFACASIVKEKLNIQNEFNFFRGTLYPDLVKNSHFKVNSTNGIFMIPYISEYLKSIEGSIQEFEIGYLVHLLLDKHYLEKFAFKFGIEPFLNKKVYYDYSIISPILLKDFNINKMQILNIIMSFDKEIDKNRLIEMSQFLNLNKLDCCTSIINYEEFKRFIEEISNVIVDEIKQIIIKSNKIKKLKKV